METGKVNPSSENDDDILKKYITELSRIENGSTQEEADDSIEARKIIRKIDWHLIPLLTLLYSLTFLDRVNIGNARLWNLERDLNMTGYQYNIAVIVFYIPVILMEARLLSALLTGLRTLAYPVSDTLKHYHKSCSTTLLDCRFDVEFWL
ncbi:hypothetical protein VTN00DRAFT_5074 [Thermoascus crustaceus]|uniref:uncharacterized protein n=1 Tax=Thermoascus crustaceus TaxID=5088 RepID=UPI003743DAC9